DYLKSVVPSQLIAERGSNIVVINPGSENIKIGLASWQTPVVIPHCIAHLMKGPMDELAQINKQKWEQIYTSPVSPAREREREEAYHMITSHLNVQPANHERGRESWFRKISSPMTLMRPLFKGRNQGVALKKYLKGDSIVMDDIDPTSKWVEKSRLAEFDPDDMGWMALDDEPLVAPDMVNTSRATTTTADVPKESDVSEPKEHDDIDEDEDPILSSGVET
ncbi:hypothetical protein KI387_020912, partial [Taxus chinensis]